MMCMMVVADDVHDGGGVVISMVMMPTATHLFKSKTVAAMWRLQPSAAESMEWKKCRT